MGDSRPNAEIDVVLVGRTGVGKSSLVNMIMGIPDGAAGAAMVSNDTPPCTQQTTSYTTSLGTVLKCNLWDTRGLDEAAGNQSIVTKLWDRLRASKQARELRETLQSRTKQAKQPILMWCVDATKVEVPVYWQQFHKVFVEYCNKNALPVVVVNRVPLPEREKEWEEWEKEWEKKCVDQLEKLNLGVDVRIRCKMVRKYKDHSSPEYKEDSEVLKAVISELSSVN